jgi:drug/metabolite transporter (DMT)-like permease
MISAHRNRAFKLLGLSFALVILLVLLIGARTLGVPAPIVAVGAILLGTFAFVFYVQGNIALAQAKGYDSSVVAAITIVASFCIGGLFFAMPLIILFGLNDKTRGRRHSRNAEPEPTRRNPPAKLPPLRNENVN